MLTPKDKILASINALKNKKLLPEHTINYFDTNPTNLKRMTDQTLRQTFKEWTCPTCLIHVYGPKQLLIQHHKIHNRRGVKENEIYQQSYNLYR